MYNLYNPMDLTLNQKIAYLQMLYYLMKLDNSPQDIELVFIRKLVVRMQIPSDEIISTHAPKDMEEVYSVLRPIRSRAIALDLLHCLWFAASIDSLVTDEESQFICSVAEILNISKQRNSQICHFVQDEMLLFEQACSLLEADVVRC